jgi:uncharacterized damage-inducible protein DinB
MNKYFHDMFDYNKYANNLFINQIIQFNIEKTKINNLISHILNAHEIWLARIQKRVARFSAWEVHSNDLLLEINLQLHIEMHYFLNTLSLLDFEGIIKYLNTKGETFENTIKDCLTHLLNHSTHHRAQISLLMRQLEIEPPKSDYIFYLREK